MDFSEILVPTKSQLIRVPCHLVTEDQYLDFHDDIETVITMWVSVNIPPFNHSCENSDGFINIFSLEITQNQSPTSQFICMCVFGSSYDLEETEFLTLFRLLDLPFITTLSTSFLTFIPIANITLCRCSLDYQLRSSGTFEQLAISLVCMVEAVTM